MRIDLVCASAKQPAWVQDGFAEYARRIRDGDALTLKELPLGRRGGSQPATRAIEQEGTRLLAAGRKCDRIVALDERGQAWSTAQLAGRMETWKSSAGSVALLVGGPDGLSPDCLDAAAERWSLSPLTLPHGLVRVLVAEALYRAWSLTRGHPYHRA